MEAITVTGISAKARAGACLRDCVMEAIILSMKEEQHIIVEHNGKNYEIDPSEVLQSVYDKNSDTRTLTNA